MYLNGSMVPTDKYRATPLLPFVWKGKIPHVRAVLMAMKSVALLVFAQDPSGEYVNEI